MDLKNIWGLDQHMNHLLLIVAEHVSTRGRSSNVNSHRLKEEFNGGFPVSVWEWFFRLVNCIYRGVHID